MKNAIAPEIVEALRNGDKQAFETIFIAYFSKIKVFLYQLIKSEEDAEELTREVFVQLWLNRSKINTGRSFDFVIYTISRNAAFNYIKHESIDEEYVPVYILPDEQDFPESWPYSKQKALLVEMTVSKMTAQRQKIFRLSRIEKLSVEEIAGQLQLSKKSVENQLTSIFRDLHKLIPVCLIGSSLIL